LSGADRAIACFWDNFALLRSQWRQPSRA